MELSSSLIQTRHTEVEVQFWVKHNVDRGLVITFRVWAHLWASGIQGRDQHQEVFGVSIRVGLLAGINCC